MSNVSYRPPYHHPSRLYHIGNDFGPHSQACLPPARERFWQPSPTRYRSRSRSHSPPLNRKQRKDRTRGRTQGDCYPGTRRAHRYRSPSPSVMAQHYPRSPRSPRPHISPTNHPYLVLVYSSYSKNNLVAHVPNPQSLSHQALQDRYARAEAQVWHEVKRGQGHMDLWSRTTLSMRDREWNWESAWDREMYERVWGRAIEEVGQEDRRRDDESRRGANDGGDRVFEAERGRQRARKSDEELVRQIGPERKESVSDSAAEILKRCLLRTDVMAEKAKRANKRKRDHDDDADGTKDRKPGKMVAEVVAAANRAIKEGVEADGRMVQKRKRDDGDEDDAGKAAKWTRADSEGDGVGQKSVGISLRREP